MNRHTDITSTSTPVYLDGALYYVTSTGGVFLELGARQGAPYMRRCNAELTERVRTLVGKGKAKSRQPMEGKFLPENNRDHTRSH